MTVYYPRSTTHSFKHGIWLSTFSSLLFNFLPFTTLPSCSTIHSLKSVKLTIIAVFHYYFFFFCFQYIMWDLNSLNLLSSFCVRFRMSTVVALRNFLILLLLSNFWPGTIFFLILVVLSIYSNTLCYNLLLFLLSLVCIVSLSVKFDYQHFSGPYGQSLTNRPWWDELWSHDRNANILTIQPRDQAFFINIKHFIEKTDVLAKWVLYLIHHFKEFESFYLILWSNEKNTISSFHRLLCWFTNNNAHQGHYSRLC